MVAVMAVMETSFKRTYARTVVFSAPDPTAGHSRPMPLPETPGHTGKPSSISCGVSAPSAGSWCTQGFVCALQESVSGVLWKFYNQITLAFKVKFPGGSQSLC